jgi:hypothetical protein
MQISFLPGIRIIKKLRLRNAAAAKTGHSNAVSGFLVRPVRFERMTFRVGV